MAKKKIFLVHCVDTEGPLNEDLKATFEMIKDIFGLTIEPTPANLVRLQDGQIPLGGKEKAIREFVRPERMGYLRTWTELQTELEQLTSSKFRASLSDSSGNPWVFNWFVMDHVGFGQDNPRGRDIGIHNIYDKYIQNFSQTQDEIQWHFHPISHSQKANLCGINYVSNSVVFEILSRKIIERGFFPSAYRPGFHTERPDSHWFLEQWIPFDFGNQSYELDEEQPDMAGGRFGYWKDAPTFWAPYHPSHDNYRIPGQCRRWITRCLNIATRTRNLSAKHVKEAFLHADVNHSAILAFTNHDFRIMRPELTLIHDLVSKVAKEFPDIEVINSGACAAMRNHLGLKTEKLDLEVSIKSLPGLDNKPIGSKVHIHSMGAKLFGPQPFFCFETWENRFYWSNLDLIDENNWEFTFDEHTFPVSAIKSFGIGGNSFSGHPFAKKFEMLNFNLEKF